MASPEKKNKHRDESLPGDISGDAVEKKDKKAEMLDRMVRFNALDREKVTAKAKELVIAEAVDNYYLIYDYNKYITGSDAEDRFKVDDYTPELMEKNLQRYARQEDCVAKVLAAFDKPKVEKAEEEPVKSVVKTPEITKKTKADKKEGWFKRNWKKSLGAVALAGVILLSGVGIHNHLANKEKAPDDNKKKKKKNNDEFGTDGAESEDTSATEEETTTEDENSVESNMEKYYGEMNNYDAPGLYHSEENGHFANAKEVKETLGEDATSKDVFLSTASNLVVIVSSPFRTRTKTLR